MQFPCQVQRDERRVLIQFYIIKNTIKKLLGKRIYNKIRKIPDLKFCMDESISQGLRDTALITQLEDEGFT